VKSSGIITLLTDFGLSDPYVGVVKGVILGINPVARLVDITHTIPPGAVLDAACVLLESYDFFPKGTVHLSIVDPGVGSGRRPIAVQAGNQFFVGPDNGLFHPIMKRFPSVRVVQLLEKKYFLPEISATFHGRDIFAPVAAHLSLSLELGLLGPFIDDPVPLSISQPIQEGHLLIGEVLRVDHFGNLITNLHRETLEPFTRKSRVVIRIGNLRIDGVRNSYSEAEPGEVLALVGSDNRLEIAVNLGRACDLDELGPESSVGLQVEVKRIPL